MTSKYLNVPGQGSPKVASFALITHMRLLAHLVATFSKTLSARHVSVKIFTLGQIEEPGSKRPYLAMYIWMTL